MSSLKQVSTGLEIPLCYLGFPVKPYPYPYTTFPASYVGILHHGDYITLEYEQKEYDLIVDQIFVTGDFECPHHEGQRHVVLTAHHADNLELLYFYNARNKARRTNETKAS
jgi:hypothetical protein